MEKELILSSFPHQPSSWYALSAWRDGVRTLLPRYTLETCYITHYKHRTRHTFAKLHVRCSEPRRVGGAGGTRRGWRRGRTMQEDTARDKLILEYFIILNIKCVYSTIHLNIHDPTADELLCFDGRLVHLQFNAMQCLKKKQFCSIGFMTRSWYISYDNVWNEWSLNTNPELHRHTHDGGWTGLISGSHPNLCMDL